MASTEYHGKYKKLFPGKLSSNSLLTVYTLHLLNSTTRMYGKEIADGIKDRLNNTWNPSHGLVYPMLRRLEELGLIIGAWEGDESKKTRRYYFITEKGRRILKKEMAGIRPMLEESMLMVETVINDLYESV